MMIKQRVWGVGGVDGGTLILDDKMKLNSPFFPSYKCSKHSGEERPRFVTLSLFNTVGSSEGSAVWTSVQLWHRHILGGRGGAKMKEELRELHT